MPAVDLEHIANCVTAMIRDSLDSFAREDPLRAAEVVRNDKAVDKDWKASLRQMITFMIEDPRTISRSIDLIFIARSLARIGDPAENMAERVLYMVLGDELRHTRDKTNEHKSPGETGPDTE